MGRAALNVGRTVLWAEPRTKYPGENVLSTGTHCLWKADGSLAACLWSKSGALPASSSLPGHPEVSSFSPPSACSHHTLPCCLVTSPKQGSQPPKPQEPPAQFNLSWFWIDFYKAFCLVTESWLTQDVWAVNLETGNGTRSTRDRPPGIG